MVDCILWELPRVSRAARGHTTSTQTAWSPVLFAIINLGPVAPSFNRRPFRHYIFDGFLDIYLLHERTVQKSDRKGCTI